MHLSRPPGPSPQHGSGQQKLSKKHLKLLKKQSQAQGSRLKKLSHPTDQPKVRRHQQWGASGLRGEGSTGSRAGCTCGPVHASESQIKSPLVCDFQLQLHAAQRWQEE